jgi:hypothetical protein
MMQQAEQVNGKRRIRVNAWGNWYGYEGRNRVKNFYNTSYATQEQNAESWLAAGKTVDELLYDEVK